MHVLNFLPKENDHARELFVDPTLRCVKESAGGGNKKLQSANFFLSYTEINGKQWLPGKRAWYNLKCFTTSANTAPDFVLVPKQYIF